MFLAIYKGLCQSRCSYIDLDRSAYFKGVRRQNNLIATLSLTLTISLVFSDLGD
jgi:hypothetical protein